MTIPFDWSNTLRRKPEEEDNVSAPMYINFHAGIEHMPAAEVKALANTLLNAVLGYRPLGPRAQAALFDSEESRDQSLPAGWHCCMAQIGAIDETVLGVQAIFLDNGLVVGLLASSDGYIDDYS
ncbi:MAG: hypothetical protein NT123_23800 [Proteobacteria bacterium]|nr:hypothetical protein [Pseudomonadota bacterium]